MTHRGIVPPRMLRRRRRERGSAALVITALLLPLLLSIGLVWDGAQKMSAGRAADTAAQEAARAAGQQLDAAAITGAGGADADPAAAVTAAQAYLAVAGVTGTVSVNGDTITVTTTKYWTPQILPGGTATLTGQASIRIATSR